MESLGDILKKLPLPDREAPDRIEAASAEPEAVAETPPCPLCGGAGFVHPRLPSGKPDYSRVVPCACAIKKILANRQEALRHYSNLGPLSDRTFDNFIVPKEEKGVPAHERPARGLQAARFFAENPEGWLVLLGPSGSGKTHLAAAIANHRLSHGHPVQFVSVPDLLDHLRATYHPSSELTYDELSERVKNAPLLILDDLGQQSTTPWAREKLDQIINHRFNQRLPTVFTTALRLEELDERWNTRLTEPKLSQVIALGERASTTLEHVGELELELLKDKTFENFRWKRAELLYEERQALEMAYNSAVEFAKQPEGWLVLEGPHGCGKTHLAAAIANYRLKEGKPAMFMFVPDLLDHLRSTFSPDSKISYDELSESVKKAPLLILDDLGGHTTTPWAQEKLYQIVNYRYNAKLPTVFTITSREDLEERIRSRLDDHSLTVFTPPITKPYYQNDYAPEKKPGPPPQRGRPPRRSL